jgi:hypothetical protein
MRAAYVSGQNPNLTDIAHLSAKASKLSKSIRLRKVEWLYRTFPERLQNTEALFSMPWSDADEEMWQNANVSNKTASVQLSEYNAVLKTHAHLSEYRALTRNAASDRSFEDQTKAVLEQINHYRANIQNCSTSG